MKLLHICTFAVFLSASMNSEIHFSVPFTETNVDEVIIILGDIGEIFQAKGKGAVEGMR